MESDSRVDERPDDEETTRAVLPPEIDESMNPEDIHGRIYEFLNHNDEVPVPLQYLKDIVEKVGTDFLRAHDADVVVRDDDDEWHRGTLWHRETLLHAACDNKHATLEVVQWLVEQYPEALRHRAGFYQGIPLHSACRNRTIRLEVVEFLIDAHPEGLWGRARFGNTPLLGLVEFNGTSGSKVPLWKDLLRLMIEKNPGCVRARDSSGSTIIHKACTWIGDDPDILAAVCAAAEACPDILKSRNRASGLPLHCCFSCLFSISNSFPGPPWICIAHPDLVQFLVDTYPDGARKLTENSKDLPLHMACRCNASLDIIQMLIGAYPDALTKRNKEGLLPLENAVSQRLELVKFMVEQNAGLIHGSRIFADAALSANIEVTRYLFGLHPEKARSIDGNGNTKLHFAARSDYFRHDKVKFLYDLYPEAIAMANNEGDTPFHVVCTQDNICLEAVQFLIARNPDAVKTKNLEGRLPLHLACERAEEDESSISLVSLLLNLYPSAAKEIDNDGCLPLHYVSICNHREIRTAHLLVESFPRAVRIVSPKRGLPIHIAASHVYYLDEYDGEDLSLIKYLCGISPDTLNTHIAGLGMPLHCACRAGAEPEFIGFFLFARYGDVQGSGLYFHSLFQDEVMLDKALVANYMLDICDDSDDEGDNSAGDPIWSSVMKRDSHNASPLHWAVTTDVGQEFIQKLMHMDEDVLTSKDHAMSVPLHYALRCKDPSNVVEWLIEQRPETLRMADSSGCFPLHLACLHGSPLRVVKMMVLKATDTIHAKDDKGELPLHKACRGGHFELVSYLLSEKDEYAAALNSDGQSPFRSLCEATGNVHPVLKDSAETVEALWVLMRKFPDAMLQARRPPAQAATTATPARPARDDETAGPAQRKQKASSSPDN